MSLKWLLVWRHASVTDHASSADCGGEISAVMTTPRIASEGSLRLASGACLSVSVSALVFVDSAVPAASPSCFDSLVVLSVPG